MSRTLRVDPSDAVPIWKQIEDGVRWLVASGALAAGKAVPSVRDLASELRVNPATVAKAYQHLTDAGVLTVKRGEGTFVAEKLPPVSRGEREKQLEGGAMKYASLAVTIGAEPEDAVERVKSALKNLRKNKTGGQA